MRAARDKIYRLNDVVEPMYEFELFDKSYVAIFATGDFDGNFDYDRGFLQFTILFDNFSTDGEALTGYITNVDDGVWQMYRQQELTQDEAIQIYKELKSRFGKKLPTEKVLNELLIKYGIYGSYTG